MRHWRHDEVSDHLCECGCGQFTKVIPKTDRARGRVKGEAFRFVAGHRPVVERASKPPRVERPDFTANPVTGCWIWQKKLSDKGYGLKRLPEGWVRAHRFYYEVERGELPEGSILHHLCENRRCVNPAHLEPMAQGDHMRWHSEQWRAA